MKLTEFVEEVLYRDDTVELEGVKAYVDRLLLRIFETVTLMQYLNKVSVFKRGGVHTVQLVFSRIPDEVIPDVQRVIGVESKVYKFDQDSTPFVGFEVPLPEELFPDKAEKEAATAGQRVGLTNLSLGLK